MFEGIIGNSQIKSYLTRMLQTKSVGNSLLFAGPDGVGKGLYAQALAKALIAADDPTGGQAHRADSGTHPDIRHYRPEGKTGMHSIDSLRKFIDEVYIAPYEAKWKIFIIHDAHRMLSYSANALLKTFEEPSCDSVIILLSDAPETLLPTVLSRCRTLYFQRVSVQDIALYLIDKYHCQADEARRIAQLSHGSVGRAVQLHQQGGDPSRQQVLDFLVKGKVATYHELTAFVKEICGQVEEQKKEMEKEVMAILLNGAVYNDLTAYQKNSLTKEMEGSLSLRFSNDADIFLETILSWYRDLHLLALCGDSEYLINKDYHAEMQQQVLRAEPIPIEKVQDAIAEARLSLARSTSLTIALENLFLKLNLL